MNRIIVYILYSKTTDSFYVGQTEDLNRRLYWHNSGEFKASSTKIAHDWEVFWYLECVTRTQALKIERHIKNMRSRKYYHSLKEYAEISERLLQQYM